MRAWILWLGALAGALAVAGTATAYSLPPDPEPIDGGPPITWIVRPTIWKLTDAATEVDPGPGAAHVECVIDEIGRLGHCTVVSEDPPHHKVGAFMLLVAKTYRAATADANGVASEGRRVRLGFNFGGARPL